MKRLMCCFLTVMMIFTCIIIPSSVSANDTFVGDYFEGDPIEMSFDASDISELTTSDGSNVQTTVFGGETYVYASSGYLNIPQIIPAVSGKFHRYVKLRLHAVGADNASKVVYIYTTSSGKRRVAQTISDAEMKTTGLVSTDSEAPGLDVVFDLLPANTTDKFALYVRPVGSDGEWTTIYTEKDYNKAAVDNIPLVIYNGLAVSSIKVYTKQAPELEAVNRAANVEEMETALTTYATVLGVDLTKLGTVEDVDAVYESLIDTVFYTAAEVVAAFDAAIEAQQGANIDCGEGDYVLATFDAGDTEDLEQLYTHDGSDVLTTEFGDGTYAHANNWLYIPQILPTIPDDEPVYVKFRIHAINDETSGKVVYAYTTNGMRAARTLNNAEIRNDRLLTSSTAGVDVIFELKAEGHATYVRTAGSEDEWTLLEENKAYGTAVGQALQIQYGLGVSEAVVYKKVAPAVAAINVAARADVEAVKTAVEENYVALGIDLSQLEGLDEIAVYTEILDKTYETAAEVVAVFDAAVKVQRILANVLVDPADILAENDKIYFNETFDAENPQIVEYGNLEVADGKAYAAERVDFYIPLAGSMPGKITRIVFKPDSASALLNISLYDSSGNRYYRVLRDLSGDWHEAVAYVDADEEKVYVWYRNIDANGSWQSVDVAGIANTGQTRIGILIDNRNAGITYDGIMVYNGLYSDYAAMETGNTVDLDGKLFYGTLKNETSRNAQFIFSAYNKQYGYISAVDVSEARVVSPAKEETVDKTYTYNGSTETFGVMFWDSIDTGIILGEAYGYKTPNKLGETETSTQEKGEIVFAGYLNEVIVSGNAGEGNVGIPVSVSIIDSEGTVVAATQTTTNLKGAFEVNVGIDAGNLASGTYTVKATCKDVSGTGTVELSGTHLDYNAIDSVDDMVTAIQDYVAPEIIALFNQDGTSAYDKFLEIKGKKAFANFFEFKTAVNEAISYTVKLNQLLNDLNAAVVAERWSDVMNLVKVEYREFLELPTNPIKGITNETELFKRMIKDDSGRFIVYETAEEIVDAFNDALAAQKLAEKPKNNGGGSGGSGGGGGYGFGAGIVKENVSSSETVEEMIEEIKEGKLKDVSSVSWAEESINALYYAGIVSGDGSGYFHPGNCVKREEFLKMILLAAGIPLDETGDLKFEDVDKDAWYFAYVNTAYKAGIIKGMSETEFGIGENITRADMAVMMNRVIDKCKVATESIRPAIIFDDYKLIPDYARTSITTLYMAGLVEGTGDNMFTPGNTATKAEAAVAINRILQLLNNQ